jgi:uncharacterized protein YjbI with pentapeptide repeats
VPPSLLNTAVMPGKSRSRFGQTQADLRQADLRWADLSQADLSQADLSEANACG